MPQGSCDTAPAVGAKLTDPVRSQDLEGRRYQGRERGLEIHLLSGIGAFAGHVAGLAAVVAGGIAPASAKAAAVLGQRRQWEAPSVQCFGKAQGTSDIWVGDWAICRGGDWAIC